MLCKTENRLCVGHYVSTNEGVLKETSSNIGQTMPSRKRSSDDHSCEVSSAKTLKQQELTGQLPSDSSTGKFKKMWSEAKSKLSAFSNRTSVSLNVFKTPNSVCGSKDSYKTPVNKSGSLGSLPLTLSKKTPPMCGCGRRAQRKMVQSPGPNEGRFFFTCPNSRKQRVVGCFTGKQDINVSCNYFVWESTNVRTMTTPSLKSSFKTPGNFIQRGYNKSTIATPLQQPDFSTPKSSELS